jgi:hypothetical protein
VREVAEGVRYRAVQARDVHDAERLQHVELADGRRERGVDWEVPAEEELGDAALLVARCGPPRDAGRAGPPPHEQGRVAELLPDLDQRREVTVGQLSLTKRRRDQQLEGQ